ncbi:hypothetical protein EES44_12550 [Streptomyces sp. ADI96-15]|nr:hypothetical protein EES44_12550 [Streptomyces sp. ADI96-15]
MDVALVTCPAHFAASGVTFAPLSAREPPSYAAVRLLVLCCGAP